MAHNSQVPQNPWFSTAELLEYLGISRKELDESSGLFDEGVHFIREFPEDPESRLLWRLDRVNDLLCISVPPLEKEAMLNALSNKITCRD